MRIKLRGGWARAGHAFMDAGSVVEVDDAIGADMVAGGFAVAVDAPAAPAPPSPADEVESATLEPVESAARTARPKRGKRGE